MNFNEHLKAGVIGGVVTAVAASYITKKPEHLAAVFGLTVAGSLFPDLDTASNPSRITALCLTIFGIVSIYTREPYLALYFMTAFCLVKSFKHRGFSHSYMIPAALIFMSYDFSVPWFAAFGIGCIIHLFIDKLYPWKLSNWLKFELPRMLK